MDKKYYYIPIGTNIIATKWYVGDIDSDSEAKPKMELFTQATKEICFKKLYNDGVIDEVQGYELHLDSPKALFFRHHNWLLCVAEDNVIKITSLDILQNRSIKVFEGEVNAEV
jgi:hypothetical protein